MDTTTGVKRGRGVALVSDDSPIVDLRLLSTAETLTLVRGVLGALSELLALDPELLDDIKTAISEACNNVVMHAYRGGSGPLEVALYTSPGAIEAVIRDEGIGMEDAAEAEDGSQGVGLPLIKALTNDAVEVSDRPQGGTEVRMVFSGHRDKQPLFAAPDGVVADDGWVQVLAGDAVVSVSPVTFLGPVLGRLARALAARARFSLDRFSDVYLVTDAIAAHATRAATSSRLGFAIVTKPRRLEIEVGPLRDGSAATLVDAKPAEEASSALMTLSDSVQSRPADGGELLHVVMSDEADSLATTS